MTFSTALRLNMTGLCQDPKAESERYRAELARHGKRGIVVYPDAANAMLFLDEDPERAWSELAPYFLRESREFASWRREGVPRPGEQSVETIEELRAQGRYEILTPAECVRRIRTGAPGSTICLHPLAGGIPIERAWDCLRLYESQVLRVVTRD